MHHTVLTESRQSLNMNYLPSSSSIVMTATEGSTIIPVIGESKDSAIVTLNDSVSSNRLSSVMVTLKENRRRLPPN